MIKLHCTVCEEQVSVRFSYNVSFGVFVKLPEGWCTKTDSQQVFCSRKCATVQGRKEMESRRAALA